MTESISSRNGKGKDDSASCPEVSLESILCTEELHRRPSRPPDYQKENGALLALSNALADTPRTVLQTLADTILEVCQSGSAGISLLSTDDGGKRFCWPAIAGAWKPHIGGGAPRDFGPCGDVLDRNTPLLFGNVALRYTYFQPVTPTVEEALLVAPRLVDPQFWIGKPQAFPPIVDQQTFERAQATIQKLRESHWSAAKVLKRIRRLLKTKGRLSGEIILNARGAPSLGTIRNYFGTQRHLYEALNYKPEPFHVYRVDQAQRSLGLRRMLCDQLTALFPGNVEIFVSRRGARALVRIDNTFMVSILFCRCEKPPRQNRKRRAWNRVGRPFVLGPCWGATPIPSECGYITLICLLSKRFDRVLDYYVVDKMGDRAYIRLRRNGEFLQHAKQLSGIRDFYKMVTKIWQRRKASSEIAP